VPQVRRQNLVRIRKLWISWPQGWRLGKRDKFF
jgi:hypothetical protein